MIGRTQLVSPTFNIPENKPTKFVSGTFDMRQENQQFPKKGYKNMIGDPYRGPSVMTIIKDRGIMSPLAHLSDVSLVYGGASANIEEPKRRNSAYMKN